MTLLEVLEDDEYLPDHGVLVIRDRHADDTAEPWGHELLGELATDALSGTIATASDGWVHGHAGDLYQAVRLEAHDEPPQIALAEWEDVVETPFHSRTGRLATQVEQAAAHTRHYSVAADLTLAAAWGHPAPVHDLAERLPIPSGDVPGLAYAITRYVEPVEGGIAARPRPPLQSSSD